MSTDYGQPTRPPSPATPAYAYAPQPYQPPHPVVVHVQAKSGGLTRAIMLMLGLVLFAMVFIVGVFIGIGGMLAGAEYNKMVLQQPWRDGTGRTIAIIPIEGAIDERQAAFVRAAADEVIKSRAFAGVILRVDSPGGGVSASDQIWHDVERIKKAGYPVVASFGGVAASGGYYVSCAADAIVAEQTCITGSIGVIAQVLTFSEAMSKVGIQPVTMVASGSPEKDTANDPFRAWTEKDRQSIRLMLDSAYDVFYSRVKAGRNKVIASDEALRAVANGSIFTAEQALNNGLVDSIGYLDDAIVQMESRCGIATDRAKVVRLSRPPSLFGDGLLGITHPEHHDASAVSMDRAWSPESIRRVMEELSTPRVLYRLH